MNNIYRVIVLFLVTMLAFACSSSGGGGGSQSANETGAGFGINANDQQRRYQTFIAASHPTLAGVEVRVRKKNATDIYSCMSVELWETDAQHKPATLLAMSSLPTVTLTTNFATLGLPLSYHGLVSGQEYAVVLEQFNAFGANAGFEWAVSDVSAAVYFGKQENGVWTDESILGDGWLTVSTDDSSGTNPVPGSLDASFGTGGTTTTSVGGYGIPRSVVIQPDGKSVVGLSERGGSFHLLRFDTDGSLDTAFNSGGTVSTLIGTYSDSSAVALQPDGKIVLAGFSFIGSNAVFALARYNPDGSPDTAFNSSGTVTTPIGANSYVEAIALQPDGKIVAAGDSYTGGVDFFALARYNPDGSLDTTFNSAGTTTTLIGTGCAARAVAIQPDGKIVAAGSSSNGITTGFALGRYNSNGSLDTTFNSSGTVTTLIGVDSDLSGLAIQPDGKIVLAGSSNTGSSWNFVLARYNPDGSPDTTLHSSGTVTTALGPYSYGRAVVLQPDGKIVVAGSVFDGSSITSMALARYTIDGNLDTSLNSSGTVTTLIGTDSNASAVAIQPDGKIVVVGTSETYKALVRYHQ